MDGVGFVRPFSGLLGLFLSHYMAPVPHRGKRNDSSLIPLVAEKIGELRGMDPQEILDITQENAKRLFHIG